MCNCTDYKHRFWTSTALRIFERPWNLEGSFRPPILCKNIVYVKLSSALKIYSFICTADSGAALAGNAMPPFAELQVPLRHTITDRRSCMDELSHRLFPPTFPEPGVCSFADSVTMLQSFERRCIQFTLRVHRTTGRMAVQLRTMHACGFPERMQCQHRNILPLWVMLQHAAHWQKHPSQLERCYHDVPPPTDFHSCSM